MTERLRVAMVGTRGMPTTHGGIERAVEEVSAGLADRGHDVTVYCRRGYTSNRLEHYRGVRLRHVPTINTKHLEAIAHTTLASLDTVPRRFDVVHFHGTGPSLLIPLARLGCPCVVATVQGLDYLRDKWGRGARTVLRLGCWSAARMPRRTVVVSRELQRHFSDAYSTEAIYIPNGVDVADTSDAPLPPFGLARHSYLLFLGRLVPEKSADLLIHAYRQVESGLPLVIAGPTTHTDAFGRELKRLAAADPRVRLVGPVYGREKEALLANAYAFCQPSKIEGLPIALLEALAFGRGPIVSDIPEHLEIVGTGVSASFVFRSGELDSLVEVLANAVDNPKRVAAAGASGRAIVAMRYRWAEIVDALEALYSELVLETRGIDVGVARARERPWRTSTGKS